MTKAFKVVLFGLLVLLIWSESSQAKEEKKATPVMALEMPTYHFGEVNEGDIVKHDFRILNRGTAPLEIKNVKPG